MYVLEQEQALEQSYIVFPIRAPFLLSGHITLKSGQEEVLQLQNMTQGKNQQ